MPPGCVLHSCKRPSRVYCKIMFHDAACKLYPKVFSTGWKFPCKIKGTMCIKQLFICKIQPPQNRNNEISPSFAIALIICGCSSSDFVSALFAPCSFNPIVYSHFVYKIPAVYKSDVRFFNVICSHFPLYFLE